MRTSPLILPVLAALLGRTSADATYQSRPDLSPPHLNITIHEPSHVEPGYLFVAPFNGQLDSADHGPLQKGPYILTNTGDLVWSGYTYFAGWSGNLQAARYAGQDVLFAFEGSHNGLHGHGHGQHTLLSANYSRLATVRAGRHELADKHEFIIHDERTALIQIHRPLQADLTPYGGDAAARSWIVDARFQELDVRTGAVLFAWRSLDHVSPADSALPLARGQAGTAANSSWAWDYFHINSVERGDDGHYLLSARHASTVYKINGSDGSTIWRLGGARSDFALGPGVAFAFQHHARYLTSPAAVARRGANGGCDDISLFDNSVHGGETSGGDEVVVFPYSRGKYIRLCHANRTATLLRALRPPGDLLVKSQGSLQALPGGNALANWGSEGAVTEFDARGRPVWHAELDSGPLQAGVQNYRAFKYNWTGWSPEEPAAVRRVGEDGEETVYVSWNGDTQTRSWRFFEVDGLGVETLAGEVERKGFETAFTLGKVDAETEVVVKAVDADGRILVVAEAERPVTLMSDTRTAYHVGQQVFQQRLGH